MSAAVAGLAAAAVVAMAWPGAVRARCPSPPRAPGGPRYRPAQIAAVASALALALLSPPLAGLVPAAVGARRRLAGRRRARHQTRLVIVGLPDAVDLLMLATDAGLTLPLAHAMIAPRLRSPVGAALMTADREAVGGRPRADAIIAALAPLGDRALALAHVLVDHLRYGVPITPGLDRLGLELRLERRRAAEQAARRVPVRLLAPLVTCTLPAFALLTVVPLLVASLRALPS